MFAVLELNLPELGPPSNIVFGLQICDSKKLINS